MSKLLPSLGGGGAAVGGMKALGSAGPAVAKGGAFAGLGIGALLGLSGVGAGLGIAAIGKGLQTFNNVDGKNLSDVADGTKNLVLALVSGVGNTGNLANAVSGMKTYARTMSNIMSDLCQTACQTQIRIHVKLMSDFGQKCMSNLCRCLGLHWHVRKNPDRKLATCMFVVLL